MRLCLTEVVDLLHCTLFDESHFCSTETIHDDTERGNMQRAWREEIMTNLAIKILTDEVSKGENSNEDSLKSSSRSCEISKYIQWGQT